MRAALAHALVAAALIAGFFLLTNPGVRTEPFGYDEADYMYAASQGWLANWIDRPSISVLEFARIGLGPGRDAGQRSGLSERIRESGDLLFYRHWHGPLFYNWLGILSRWTVDEYRARSLSRLIPAAGIALVYFGVLWLMPKEPATALLATVLYGGGFSVDGALELAPHQLFVVVSLAGLFCLARLELTGERRWWWWAVALFAISFDVLEVAFVGIATLLLEGWRQRRVLNPGGGFWLRSAGLFAGVSLALWPAGIGKLEIARSYGFMAYLAMFAKNLSGGEDTLASMWQWRIEAEPVEWMLAAAAVLIWWRMPKSRARAAGLPFLLFGVLMFVALFSAVATSARYALPFLAPLLVFAGITFAGAMQNWSATQRWVVTLAIALAVASGSWRFVRAHVPPPAVRAPEVLAAVRAHSLAGRSVLVPIGDLPLVHYYFPSIHWVQYRSEAEKQESLRGGGIGAVIGAEEPVRIEER